MKTRVLVADGHAHGREGIAGILARNDLFEVIAQAENGRRALELTEQLLPDLIILDIEMPGMDGFAAARTIRLRFPYIKIVLVSAYADAAYLLEAMKQGAQGFLLKNLPSSVWLEYLQAIMDEETKISAELASLIFRDISASGGREKQKERLLTAREREIMPLVAQGLTNREIAVLLDISDQTVKNHLKNILHKLQLANRVQLARYAIERGWLKARHVPKNDKRKATRK